MSSAKLQIEETIGEGGFGMVYKAHHSDWGQVAYKKLNSSANLDKLDERYMLLICSCVIRDILAVVVLKSYMGLHILIIIFFVPIFT